MHKFYLLMLILASACAQVQDNPIENMRNARNLVATCAGCHGTEGRAAAGASAMLLAGRPRERLISQMKAFKEDKQSTSVMHLISKGYTDAQIESLATYLAAQK